MTFRAWSILAAVAGLSVGPEAWAQVSTTYGYDAQGQVISVDRGGTSTGYVYDQAGNRVRIAIPAQGAAASAGAASAKSTAAVASKVQANTPPAAVYDGVVALPAGQSRLVDLVANDIDADGDVLSLSALDTAGAVLATYSLDGGKLQIRAGARAGGETITYTVSDGRGGAATAVLSVLVTAGAPTANGLSAALGAKATQP